MQTEKRRRQRPGRASLMARLATGTGRWALLAPAAAPAEDDVTEARARLYVRRYGVVFRDLLPREPGAPAWRDLLRVYRRLEMRGELRGGRIVGGFVGEQFAAPEALEALRAIRREPADGQVVRVSACDPLNSRRHPHPGPARARGARSSRATIATASRSPRCPRLGRETHPDDPGRGARSRGHPARADAGSAPMPHLVECHAARQLDAALARFRRRLPALR